MVEANLVASLKTPPSSDGGELLKLNASVRWLEVRADLTGWIDPDWLRTRFAGRVLYSLRSGPEGGAFNGTNQERRENLLRASRGYDLVELEANRDLQPESLAAVPTAKRMVSSHGVPPNEVEAAFGRSSSVPARLYKLVTRADCAADGLAPLGLLKRLARSDVVAYAAGQVGLWSRLIAPRLGARMVFGLAGDNGNRNGEPTIRRLIEDFGLPALRPLEEMYGIVGNPVSHSLSPRLHNAAYRALKRPALFLPFQVESFIEFWRDVASCQALEPLGVSIKGLTVVSPYKEVALGSAGAHTAMVQRAGSTNIFVRNNGHWKADTTDPEGVARAIRARGIGIKGKRAAVVGCGGAGRAVAAALQQEGAAVTLVNRGLERGRRAVELLGLPFSPLADFKTAGFAVVVNATPVGRDGNEMPFDVGPLDRHAVVVDLAYGRNPTPLVERARSRGLTTIDGREVLLIQVAEQFRMMTGRHMPEGLACEVLGLGHDAAASAGAGHKDHADGNAEGTGD